VHTTRAGRLVSRVAREYVPLVGSLPRGADGAIAADDDRLADFVRRNARTPLGPFLRLPGNQVLELAGGRAVVGYRRIGRVFMTVGEPVAEPGLEEAALSELIDHCNHNRFRAVLVQVSEEGTGRARALGLRAVKMSEEATIPLADFALSGKAHANLRHSVSHARRAGVTARRYDDVVRTPERDARLHEISDAWLKTKHGPEMGFTLGRFNLEELRFQDTFIAEVSGEIVAFVSWYAFRDGRAVVPDLMRRSPQAPPGTMELLLVHGIEEFAAHGCDLAALGGAPFASTTARHGAIERAFGFVYERGGRFYEGKGLFAFKKKFAPRWEPQYVLYPARRDVPRTILALLRAWYQ
jgi:phosphatidylglycerol lysyltransferase